MTDNKSFYVMILNAKTKSLLATVQQKGKFLVGRKSSAKKKDVGLETEDTFMSGQQFIIAISDKNEVTINDANSPNGTFYFHKMKREFIRLDKENEVLVINGDVIKAGTTDLILKMATPQGRNAGGTEVVLIK